jgi:glutaredoxin-like YruB-family protein
MVDGVSAIRGAHMSVVVYSTPSCPYCTMAKDFLKKKQVPFEDYDVSRDERRAEEMIRKSGQMGVPVLDVNGRILVGFRPADIENALKN